MSFVNAFERTFYSCVLYILVFERCTPRFFFIDVEEKSLIQEATKNIDKKFIQVCYFP